MKIGIVMAGGKGKRMNSDIPKVCHKINNKSMIRYVVETLQKCVDKIIVIINNESQLIKYELISYNVDYVIQNVALGTGHAIKCTLTELEKYSNSKVIIMSGDQPFIKEETINKLLKHDASMLSCHLDNPNGYGRLILNNNNVIKIVEDKDCTIEQKNIKYVNAGTYVFSVETLLKYIPMINNNNAQKEYYLTDLIELYLQNNGTNINNIVVSDNMEIVNINTKNDLEKVCELFN